MPFETLYREIWRQAIKDEIKHVTDEAYYKGVESAYSLYIKKADEPVCLTDKRLQAIKKDIKDFARLKSDVLDTRIRELVYKESQEWPHNSRKLKQDEEYNELLQALIDETVEFARERMENRWMKI